MLLLPLPGNPRMMYSVFLMLFVVEYPSVHPEEYVCSSELKCYHAGGDAPFKNILKQPQADFFIPKMAFLLVELPTGMQKF